MKHSNIHEIIAIKNKVVKLNLPDAVLFYELDITVCVCIEST